jgi:hypothetical protein
MNRDEFIELISEDVADWPASRATHGGVQRSASDLSSGPWRTGGHAMFYPIKTRLYAGLYECCECDARYDKNNAYEEELVCNTCGSDLELIEDEDGGRRTSSGPKPTKTNGGRRLGVPVLEP